MAEEASCHYACVIDDHQRIRVEEVRQIADGAVLMALFVEDQEPSPIAILGRVRRNQVRGQLVMEEITAQSRALIAPAPFMETQKARATRDGRGA